MNRIRIRIRLNWIELKKIIRIFIILTQYQIIVHLSNQSPSLSLCSIDNFGWLTVYWFHSPSLSNIYTSFNILLRYIISSSKKGGSLGYGHFDIAIMSLFGNKKYTSVAPWQNIINIKLLGQQSSRSDCDYS